jgi:hypothetical protein
MGEPMGQRGVPDRIVIVDPDDAELIFKLLSRLQLLLRFGELSVEQLRLVVDGGGLADADAAERMADVVGEALDSLRRQIGEP